ncbi:MAG: GntR family transcriptional regulator [Thermoleophilia bacterium]|nr:GntR family transcriptional regulator [Thermoleophilia bacterium]
MSAAADPARPRRKPSPRTDAAEHEIRQWLVQRQHRPGDRLPADVELAQMLGVARSTVIAALDRLEDDGVIMRRQGSGTFVREVPLPTGAVHGLEVFEAYPRTAARQGRPLGIGEIRIEPDAPLQADVAGVLGVGAGAPAPCITTTLVTDGRPRARTRDHVHPDIALPEPDALRDRIRAGESVLDVLIASRIPVAYGQTEIRGRLVGPDTELGAELGVASPVAAVELVETAHLASGACVRHSVDVFLPGALDLQVFRRVDLRHAARPRALPRGGRAV